MAYGTLERSPPPFFRQGPSALTRLLLFSALAVLLMALDARFKVTPLLRQGLSVAVYPLQRLAQAPVDWSRQISGYLEAPVQSQQEITRLKRANVALSLQAQMEAQLRLENNRLRTLLHRRASLRNRIARLFCIESLQPATQLFRLLGEFSLLFCQSH